MTLQTGKQTQVLLIYWSLSWDHVHNIFYGKQTIEIHILPNISRNKGNHTAHG